MHSYFQKIITITFLLLLGSVFNAFGQSGTMEKKGPSFSEDGSAPVDAGKIQPEIKLWKLTNDFTKIQAVYIDTSMMNFHQYNPIFKDRSSNTYLGYLGAPYENNYFFKRNRSHTFYFLRNMEAYTSGPQKVNFYNTKTPFSFLHYTQSLNSQTATEQYFRAFYTQNIDSTLNFGIDFSTIKNEGPYNIQEATHRNFNLMVSKNTERYNAYFYVTTGENRLVENGGITTDVINPASKLSTLLVNLPTGVESSIKNYSIFTKQEYLLGRTDTILNADSSIHKIFSPIFAASYHAEYKNYARRMTESSVNKTYFSNSYLGTSTNYTDTLWFRKFEHSVHLKAMESAKRKFTFGKRAFIRHEIVMASHPLLDGIRKYNYSNVSVGGELYQQKSKFLQWSADGEVVLLGRNIGDAILRGNLIKPIQFNGDTILVTGTGWYQDQSPDIYQEHLLLNHIQYENNFSKQHEVVLKGKIDYHKYNLSIGVDYALLSNYLYSDSLGLPNQLNSEFSIFGIWLKKDFVFGRFGSQNKINWQEVSNASALNLPTLTAYSNIYYHHYLFKVMEIQLGAELYYNTAFYADKYNVSTNQFYYQTEQLIGGFPEVNVFINAKLKRTNAFVRLYNVTANYGSGNYFGSPNYPLDKMAIRFGFFWTFYD